MGRGAHRDRGGFRAGLNRPIPEQCRHGAHWTGMTKPKFIYLFAGATLALASCGQGKTPPPSGEAEATTPAGEAQMLTVEGRIEQGVECPVLHTPEGRIYALNLGEADFAPADYVRISGELADASFCQQGKGTLQPKRIDKVDPPARDRDPARAGGIAVTADYVLGEWVAKGLNADCAKPDLTVTRKANGMALVETRIDGLPETGAVSVGSSPALHWDEPLQAMPIEARGPDGLAVMPGGGKTVALAGHPIVGDGVVFVRCAD